MSPTQAYFDHDDEDLDGQDNRKRSSRACDQCRKTKSKCERTHPDDDNVPCKTCMLNNTVCTFAGPSYKRGPPKGYIHAIEQRWHHVEAVLGSILSSHDPRAQSLINDLRKDDLAREILNRVDVGPFGPAGRIRSSGRVDSLSSLLLGGRADGHSSHASKEGRSRRQSRVSREIVSSSQDLDPLPEATLEWQDRLTSRIGGTGYASASTNGYPSSQRRRLDAPEFDKMYTFESTDTSTTSDSQEEGEDHIDAMGHLSLDENREVRFHGKASGLHLISNRTDDRKDGGLWKLPMPGVWPPSTIRPVRLEQEEDIEIHLPAIGDQDHLLELYFTYVHPGFPVIHKGRFLEEWQSQRRGSPIIDSHPRNRSGSPYSSQVSKALLLAMFALAARYLEQPPEGTHAGAMWEIGCNYALDCREVLNKIYHHSRLSTCQALLLLSLHEFGIGMTEHAWMFIGMAIRMAEDLGLNRVADHWKYKGNDLFTPDEKQMRKVVWFGCYIVDVFISVYLGRPSAISDCDYDTPLPDIPDDDAEPWRPYVHDPGFHPKYNPGPGHVISCFRQTMGVIRIQSDIIKQIYPVVYVSRTPKRVRLAELEKRLDQWYIDLPEELRYESVGKRAVPPPHIMVLHVRYWSAVLLLHRAFIPRMNDAMAPRGSTDHDTVVLKSFDLCQSAASHISTIVAQYDEHFGMKRSPLFLACYILSAGIMHVVTLNLRENNIQASIGLRQCLAALEKMETIWPSASRHKDLLTGADVQFQGILTPLANAPERYKRPADDLHNSPDKASHILQRQVFNNYDPESSMGAPAPSDDTRVMARMLGLEVGPGIQPSTSYFPGYEWWPSIPISAPHHHQQHPQQGQPGQMRGHPDALPPMHIPQPGSHPSSQQTSPTTASSNHEWTSPSAYPGYGYGPPANGYGYAR